MSGLETRSQEWRKEITSMVQEAEHRQEMRLHKTVAGQEARFRSIVDELKSMIAGLSWQNMEIAEQSVRQEPVQIEENVESPDRETVGNKNRAEQVLEGNVCDGNPWGSNTKLEFPWLLRAVEEGLLHFKAMSSEYGPISSQGGSAHPSGRIAQMMNADHDSIACPQPRVPPPRRQQKTMLYNNDLFL
ncbi:hypothetical protein GH714_037282 [Hevea brasiliensis]|uniref:Uncharacterized protein n=1 Tax=Hevea brasiliensis TaxID=3981 RepID=A0A6A6KG62_HEVBR|nr:hypothetical protein GH714_037282 [Hevea brasiliensis]